MYEARGKVVIVTGGAAGIGAGVVKAFLDEGAKHVAALDVDVKSGITLQDDLSSKYGPGKIKFYKCDITSNDLENVYDTTQREFGHINIVVNCAGIMNDQKHIYLKEIAVNLSALVTSSLKAYDIMREDHGGEGGTIINISSIVALFKASLLPVYAATKSAVLQFSNCLGMEPHYPGSGVRVITVCFGVTNTTLLDKAKTGSIDKETDEKLAKFLEMIPKQSPESAVSGLIEAFKRGASGSTWLVTSNRPAEDISGNITKAYELMGQGLFT